MAVRRLHANQPAGFTFTPENLAWVKNRIGQYPAGKQASAVIPVLWRAQEQEGWCTEPAIRTVAELLGMAFIRVYEIATFYTMFHLAPVGKTAHVQVCGTTPCMLRGSDAIIEVCRSRIHHDQHHVADGFSWEEVECGLHGPHDRQRYGIIDRPAHWHLPWPRCACPRKSAPSPRISALTF